MILIKDGYHLPILAHKYELLPTYLNILMCELHSEPQEHNIQRFLKQGYQKIMMIMTVVECMVLLVPHAI
jgi:hypothetical protein